MLKNHIKEIFCRHLNLEPTEKQIEMIDLLVDMIYAPANNQLMLVKGYAGTGKTSLISAFVRTLKDLKIPSTLMAPTGRAAKVLSSYAQEPAFTVHKKIYRQKSAVDGLGTFVLNFNTYNNMFFIVDEASMISHYSADRSIFGTGNLLDDLITFVYNERNCRLILLGDTAQLPPVGQDESPALDKRRLERFGLKVFEGELTQVVRQSQESGILYNATIVREIIQRFKDSKIFDSTKLIEEFLNRGIFESDVEHVAGEDLLEAITDAYDRYGTDETIVICRSNKQANRYNQGIRNRILYREEGLTSGDLLMVVRNNYHWIKDQENISFIANGDIVRLIRVRKYIERYDFRFAKVDLCLPDYDHFEFSAIIMLDALGSEAATITEAQNQHLYRSVAQDYAHLSTQKERNLAIREDPFFNALQVKFAYAVTCHKAQGGQWQCVFLDHGWLNTQMLNQEYMRWLYTAITRATQKLYMVNFRSPVKQEEKKMPM